MSNTLASLLRRSSAAARTNVKQHAAGSATRNAEQALSHAATVLLRFVVVFFLFLLEKQMVNLQTLYSLPIELITVLYIVLASF